MSVKEFKSKSKKEYNLKCKICGSIYKLQGTEEQLNQYLSIFGFNCEPGRHVELGTMGQYLEIVSESNELSSLPKIEPKKQDEYEAYELPEGLEHIGFGIFKDTGGNVWDYRLGPKGERLYSKK